VQLDDLRDGRRALIVTATGEAEGSYVPICSLNLPSRGLRESVATTW